MRVLITGSRNWEGFLAESRVGHVLDMVQYLSLALDSPLVIVHGGCPTGADAIADRWARRRDYEPEVHPANWSIGGKGAGMFRNNHMVKLGADMCIGFLRDASRGTTHCLIAAKAAGIPTFTVHWNRGGEDVDQDH
jgi:Protein of unknown function (DUF2493).